MLFAPTLHFWTSLTDDGWNKSQVCRVLKAVNLLCVRAWVSQGCVGHVVGLGVLTDTSLAGAWAAGEASALARLS